jgi:6-phosphogluconate dehydrogenase
MANCDIGLVGLAVMGENLVLNLESRGFTVGVHNRTTSKIDDFTGGRAKGKKIVGCHTLEELAKSLKKPRKVMLMVKAGNVVDIYIEKLLKILEKGDIIIDGGNSNFNDTNRRTAQVKEAGLWFIGAGVSGGEEGALKGPSIMPGGSPEAWPEVKPLFQAICAKVEGGAPCCDWVGDNGAGHYVKMVHNGVEYGDMQMICEAYYILKTVLGLNNEELKDIFTEWNQGDLDSYLVEITRDIMGKKDEEEKEYVVDQIMDRAGQKGTGKWTAISALDMGMPVTLIGEAVFARCLSAQKEERVVASDILKGPESEKFTGDKARFISDVKDALFASKIVSYAQGFVLIRAAAKEYGWNVDCGSVALMWRGGCIIRSKFLNNIKEAFDKKADLDNLLLDDWFNDKIHKAQAGWRSIAAVAVTRGIPCPCITSALAYYDGYRTARLPANLLQAQRDYFGAHTYERVDKPRGEFFHTNWTGRGGTTASSTYNV